MNIKTLLFLLISTISYSQTKEKILLEWKISKNDTLKYKTSMKATRQEIANTDRDSLANAFEEIRKSMSEANSNAKYQSNLFVNNRNENLIDIEMLMLNDEKDNDGQNFEELIAEFKSNSDKKSKKKKKRTKKKTLKTIV